MKSETVLATCDKKEVESASMILVIIEYFIKKGGRKFDPLMLSSSGCYMHFRILGL